MTSTTPTNHDQTSNSKSAIRNEKPPKRHLTSRYDILIQCRDEAEQRELFEQLREMGMKLRLLVL